MFGPLIVVCDNPRPSRDAPPDEIIAWIQETYVGRQLTRSLEAVLREEERYYGVSLVWYPNIKEGL